MMKKILIVAVFACLAGGLGFFLGVNREPSKSTSKETSGMPRADEMDSDASVFENRRDNGRHSKVVSSPIPMRRRIEIAADGVRGTFKSMDELNAYLARMERTAIENGRVSAMEVQPAVEAISSMVGTVMTEQEMFDLRTAFSTHMATVSEHLRNGRSVTPMWGQDTD